MRSQKRIKTKSTSSPRSWKTPIAGQKLEKEKRDLEAKKQDLEAARTKLKGLTKAMDDANKERNKLLSTRKR